MDAYWIRGALDLHQGGHMENTVETLLLHGDGSPDELIRKLPIYEEVGSGGEESNDDGSKSLLSNEVRSGMRNAYLPQSRPFFRLNFETLVKQR
jgi:hypothetical protein